MLSLPNLLTLSRILAVPILVFLLWRPAPLDYAITFVLYCVVGITDYFDGYLARAKGQISRLGQFLDPIADKIMIAAVLMMLISSRKANPVPEIAGLHIIPALVILLRMTETQEQSQDQRTDDDGITKQIPRSQKRRMSRFS